MLFKNAHKPFLNTLNVHSFLLTSIHELFINVHEQFMINSPGYRYQIIPQDVLNVAVNFNLISRLFFSINFNEISQLFAYIPHRKFRDISVSISKLGPFDM